MDRSTTNSASTPPPLRITIRFATHSIPDLPLLISSNVNTTASPDTLLLRHLKVSIRPHLPSDLQGRGLKLIHAGRVLEDKWSLSTALRLQTPGQARWKGKGKARAVGKDVDPEEEEQGRADTWRAIMKDEEVAKGNMFDRMWVHCSISPASLSALELAAETAPSTPTLDPSGASYTSPRPRRSMTSTSMGGPRPEARGFDALLSTTSFTQADIASLRTQFRNIISSRHTPDTMPSPDALRGMEEEWLENSAFTQHTNSSSTTTGHTGAAAAQTRTAGGFEDEEGSRTQMYETLLGACMGFFWGVGALAWGLREEGVWSRRRSWAVVLGVGVNVCLGVFRAMS